MINGTPIFCLPPRVIKAIENKNDCLFRSTQKHGVQYLRPVRQI